MFEWFSAQHTPRSRGWRAALDVLRRGRTTLVIAHQPSTVPRADQILVLERGAVVERWTHSALLARGGRCPRLCAAQRWEVHDVGT